MSSKALKILIKIRLGQVIYFINYFLNELCILCVVLLFNFLQTVQNAKKSRA